MKILLTGGSGLLGKELLKINDKIIAPSSDSLDVTSKKSVGHLYWEKPDIIIHAAACLSEKFNDDLISINIIGTANIAIVANDIGARLVYLSTDYIYKGTKGNYSEDSEILPYNLYAWSKLGGECAVKGVKNHLIIRTTFGDSKFPYEKAFVDAYRSKDYIDIIAPMIYEAATSDLQGVINIGTERKTMYEYAIKRNKDVMPVTIEESGFQAPPDTSFNLTKWNNFKNGKGNM